MLLLPDPIRLSPTMKLVQVITFFVLFFLMITAYTKAPPIVGIPELAPTKKQAHINELIFNVISAQHYRKVPLDDDLSEDILNRYLERLDPNRWYFLKYDIEAFNRYKNELDDAIKTSDLEIAYTIFKRYRKRVEERADYAQALIKGEFDFTLDEEYQFNREDVPWVENVGELNDVWRKRIKNDLLNLQLSDKEKTMPDLKEMLRKRYQRFRVSTQQLNSDDVFQLFVNAYTAAIEPHTAYFSPRVSENFNIGMRLSLQGIGAVLKGDNDHTVVVKTIPGGPADISGLLHPEDRIIGVGQGNDDEIVDIIGWRLDDVVDLIRGPKGTKLRLKILPKDMGTQSPSKVISLQRDQIKLEEQAAKSSVIKLAQAEKKIGVVDLPTFYTDFLAQSRGEKDYRSTTRDVKKLIESLNKEQIDGLIIDLRGNGGGALSEVVKLTGLFINVGPVVQTKDAAGKIQLGYDHDPDILYTGPLAVLVDRHSASASEIFAGAIQDYQRGIVLGEVTFGKGTVQNVIDLNDLADAENYGQLKITTAQFFRISGISTQYQGVVPDIIFPIYEPAREQGERMFDNAIPWTSIGPVEYVRANAPIDSLAKIKVKYEQHVPDDVVFNLFLEKIKQQREQRDKETISLLKEKRLADYERLTANEQRIENEIRSAYGLAALPDEKQTQQSDNLSRKDESVDIILEKSAHILGDLIVPAPVIDQAARFKEAPFLSSVKNEAQLN